jgi:hypothetical protein
MYNPHKLLSILQHSNTQAMHITYIWSDDAKHIYVSRLPVQKAQWVYLVHATKMFQHFKDMKFSSMPADNMQQFLQKIQCYGTKTNAIFALGNHEITVDRTTVQCYRELQSNLGSLTGYRYWRSTKEYIYYKPCRHTQSRYWKPQTGITKINYYKEFI